MFLEIEVIFYRSSAFPTKFVGFTGTRLFKKKKKIVKDPKEFLKKICRLIKYY